MAKTKLAAADPVVSDEWQDREDVDRLMRADDVHADPKRLKRAFHRISGTADRLKRHMTRSRGRSSKR